MTAGGGHAHDHALTATGRHRGRLAAVMAITLSIAAGEIAGAVLSGSLVLLADAAHMAADAAGVGLSLLAAHFASKPATERRTFGYARAEILAATANALLLLGMATFIVVEAARRLGVAAAGEHRGDGGVRLHRAGRQRRVTDPAPPGPGREPERPGRVPGGRVGHVRRRWPCWSPRPIIAVTGLTLADPIASLAVGVLILPRTWRLLRDAVDVLLEASPRGIDLSEVRQHMTGLDGVIDVHDLHAWTITSGLPVLSAHVVVDPGTLASGCGPGILDQLQECVRGHFDVAHSTFQIEPAGHADHEPVRSHD